MKLVPVPLETVSRRGASPAHLRLVEEFMASGNDAAQVESESDDTYREENRLKGAIAHLGVPVRVSNQKRKLYLVRRDRENNGHGPLGAT